MYVGPRNIKSTEYFEILDARVHAESSHQIEASHIRNPTREGAVGLNEPAGVEDPNALPLVVIRWWRGGWSDAQLTAARNGPGPSSDLRRRAFATQVFGARARWRL